MGEILDHPSPTPDCDEGHWHAHTRELPWGLPEVIGMVQQVYCSQRRLLQRGLEFHVCTINKSAHTKKSGNLSYAPRIYFNEILYSRERVLNKRKCWLVSESVILYKLFLALLSFANMYSPFYYLFMNIQYVTDHMHLTSLVCSMSNTVKIFYRMHRFSSHLTFFKHR